MNSAALLIFAFLGVLISRFVLLGMTKKMRAKELGVSRVVVEVLSWDDSWLAFGGVVVGCAAR